VFERFTDRARAVVVLAQDEARRLRHGYVGTEHLLLALLRGNGVAKVALERLGVDHDAVRADVVRIVGEGPPPNGPADEDAQALRAFGIDLDEVRRRVEEAFGPGALERDVPVRRRRRKRCGAIAGHVPFTPRAKKALELALREALRLRHGYIGTEHILLGLAREGEGLAAQVLSDRNAGPHVIRTVVEDLLFRSEPGRPA
jgi:ATP-dependent Clp protease ATP-binding subunit ClpA